MPTYGQGPGMRHFWLRRLHSLAGIAFGGYVTVHLLVNATALLGPRVFQQNVDKIHDLQPLLPFIEAAAIFTPLLVHMVYGIWASFAGVNYSTTLKYNYGGNIRYVLQRVTAIILIFFILYHVLSLHKLGQWLGGGNFEPANLAYQTTVKSIARPFGDNMAANAAVMAFYLLGTWSAVFHWANGLWTSAIAWGLTTTAAAQRRWGHACLGFGVIMMIVGTLAWAAFTVAAKHDVPPEATFTKEPHDAKATYGPKTDIVPASDAKPGH